MITQETLKELGWVKGGIYYPGSSEAYGIEYLWEKGLKRIRVNEKNGEILSYDGHQTSLIKNIQELSDYEKR